MAERIYHIVNRYTGLVATGMVLLLFIAVNTASTPLLNSGDDAFLMYTLAGGYGEQPTNLLQYDHIWHPWLGYGVARLFSYFPGTNWYSLLLTFFHLTGCIAILYVFLKRWGPRQALFFFLVLFCFIEIRLLLSLTFTGAAFVAATGALTLLLHRVEEQKAVWAGHLPAFLLLVLSGMLRPQVTWLAIFLLLPSAFFLLGKTRLLKWGAFALAAVGLLLLLNGMHRRHYEKNIPGWKQQEQFRQALFKAYNRPVKSQPEIIALGDTGTLQLYFAAFLYDSSKFNPEKVAAISRKVTRQRSFSNGTDREGLYWFFIEMRIYILLFAVMIIPLLLQKRYTPVLKWLLSLAAFLAVHGFLFMYMKLTPPLHLGMLLILWISLVLQLSPADAVFGGNKKIILSSSLLSVFLFAWMGLRVTRENNNNRDKHQRFLCAAKSIGQHRDKLFVATYDIFPLDYFYIWDTPSRFPVTNLLYKDRLLTYTYPFTLQRFGITDINTALHDHHGVYLLGPPLPVLLNREQQEIFTGPLPGFGCLEVRQIIKAK